MRYSKGKSFFLKGEFLFGNKIKCIWCSTEVADGKKCIVPFYIADTSACVCKKCDKIGLDWR